MPLTVEQINSYREDGFLTLESIFPLATIAELKADSEIWAAFFLSQLSPEERQWYVEGDDAKIIRLRKLDNPHIHRPLFAALIQSAEILEMLTSLLKGNPICFFSQLFFKPPEGGGPKPTHQDNFYFRPQDQEDIITVWVALDDATPGNGCLHYWRGSHRGPLITHTAPGGEPFNLQIPEVEWPVAYPQVPAPVAAGGINLHHGRTLHQSANNLSPHPRRAVAFHIYGASNRLVDPPLVFDEANFRSLRKWQ